VEWHVQTLARVRAESWIPGMAGEQDPMVERALSRFSSYHMRTTIARLREENTALQRKLVDAVTCARFYAAGATDAGACARTALTTLLAPDVMVTETPAWCGAAPVAIDIIARAKELAASGGELPEAAGVAVRCARNERRGAQ